MESSVERVLITQHEIMSRVEAMGEEIASTLAATPSWVDDPELVVVPVMTGALVFAADLIRRLRVRMRIVPVTISSYPGASTSSQGAYLVSAAPADLHGRHVLIIDDILDSGRTLSLLRGIVGEQHPAAVFTSVLLEKEVERAEAVTSDFVGFRIPDRFVVGYGLDYDGYYRNLPEIAVLRLDDGGAA